MTERTLELSEYLDVGYRGIGRWTYLGPVGVGYSRIFCGEKRLDGASWLGRGGLESSLYSVRELVRLLLHLFTGDPVHL